MEIDYDRLRADLINFYQGAYFVGGFGAALMDTIDIEKMSDEELVKFAIKKGFKIEDYKIYKRK